MERGEAKQILVRRRNLQRKGRSVEDALRCQTVYRRPNTVKAWLSERLQCTWGVMKESSG